VVCEISNYPKMFHLTDNKFSLMGSFRPPLKINVSFDVAVVNREKVFAQLEPIVPNKLFGFN